MTALVTIDRNTHAPTPADGLIRAWATETLAASSRGRVERPEICIRITDTDEAAHFNKVYRSKTQATNVLSFPADLPPGTPSGLLGDLVICAQVVQQEAKLQNKGATNFSSEDFACTNNTSPSHRCAFLIACPVPTATTFTVIPVSSLTIGRIWS